MLLEFLLLEDPVVFLKSIEQMERHRIVFVIIPHLDQIDSRVPVKKRVVQVESIPLPQDLIPIAHVKIQIPARFHQLVHLPKRRQDIFIAHIRQRISRAGDTVKSLRKPFGNRAKIAALHFYIHIFLLCLLPATR